MKKILMMCLCLLLSKMSFAQGFAQAEYFIDTDPGIGNGVAVPMTITNADSVLFNASIPITSLSDGFHFVSVRMKENSGNWGLFETRGFFIASTTTNVGNIVAAEYFIDTDPGIGNATAASVGTNGDTVNFLAAIPTNSLTPGFHHIAIRTKDIHGVWGLFEGRGFFISSVTGNVGNIVAAEYFIDADPGIGNATATSVGTNGDTVNFVANIPTTSLTDGFHHVAIRTKDVNGNWGLFESRGFFISSGTTNVSNIVAAEYFIDIDPGIGNATATSIGTNGDTVNFIASIPTTSLSNGFHHIALRTKDADGNWGLFESRGFYISPSGVSNNNTIVAAEYFIDTDPGVGNATSLAITTPDTTINQTFVCATPSGLTSGQHFIFIRVQDNENNWSLYEMDTFTVDFTLPLTGLSLSARKLDKEILAQWQTLTEQNTSYFELEKSSNGTEFEKITIVKAQGNSKEKSEYSFIDKAPNSPINFYRIKQVDLDGKSSYSNIATVLFETSTASIRIYPNPATTIVKIDLPTVDNYVIQCYNTQGQLVLSQAANAHVAELNIGTFASGTYQLRISNGVSIQNGTFIKN